MSVDKVLTKIEASRRELAEICSQLIQIRTQHSDVPGGVTATAPLGRTTECVAHIKNYFDDLGIPTEIHHINEEKHNLVARIKGTTSRRIMWLGHLDVVPEGGT
jgi:acetylornithine deacetylase/succinyl-diaminopimelate desuccinylase-like protein